MRVPVDRLIANQGGSWDTLRNLGDIACALCTAASKHEAALALAREMLERLVAASGMSKEEKAHAKHGFQHAKTAVQPFDPRTTLEGFASGLSSKREQALVVIREAIDACTDTCKEADVVRAAASMLEVLEFEDRECTGTVASLGNISALGMFLFYIWLRHARYGLDGTQPEAQKWRLYLFNGATYKRDRSDQFEIQAEEHIIEVLTLLIDAPLLRARAGTVLARCQSTDLVAAALRKAHMSLKNAERLEACGLLDPEELEDQMDMGSYIGFPNGVYNVLDELFIPKGSVSPNILVSMSTKYAYVGRDDPRFLEALHAFRHRSCVLPLSALQIEGPVVRPLENPVHQVDATQTPEVPVHRHANAAQTPEGQLRAWVAETYVHVPFRERDTGTRLDALLGAYKSAIPQVHTTPLGKNQLAVMLGHVHPGVGPHKSKNGTVRGLYLLR
jgi:hypothetical protein